MKKKILTTIIATFVLAFAGIGVALTSNASATSDKAVICSDGYLALDGACGGEEEHGGEGDNNLWTTIKSIIDLILVIVGLIAVVMIIVGGITYATSAGDPGKVKKAKDTILYGIVGLVVALLAFAIVNFALTNVFGNTEK